MRWGIPRGDPRLLEMTPEEFEFEFLAYRSFSENVEAVRTGKPIKSAPDDQFRRLVKGLQSGRIKPPSQRGTEIDPETFFGGGEPGWAGQTGTSTSRPPRTPAGSPP